MRATAGGIPWYRKEDYPLLLTIFEDARKLPGTYEDWLARAENGFKAIERSGARAVRVIIDPYEFPTWCAATGHKLDAKGRIRYAALIAMKAVHDN